MNWTVSEMFLLPASNPRARRKARNPLRRESARRILLQTPTLLSRGDDPFHALCADPAFGFWRLPREGRQRLNFALDFGPSCFLRQGHFSSGRCAEFPAFERGRLRGS